MPYQIERLPDESIIIFTITDFEDVNREIQEIISKIAGLMKEIEGPVVRIADLRELDLSFSEVVMALATTSKGVEGSAGDPRTTTFIVGTGQMSQLLADSLSQKQYGSIQARFFHSLEEALEQARSKLGSIS